MIAKYIFYLDTLLNNLFVRQNFNSLLLFLNEIAVGCYANLNRSQVTANDKAQHSGPHDPLSWKFMQNSALTRIRLFNPKRRFELSWIN